MTQKKRKIVTGVVAGVVAASLALTGTYAWFTTQSALNDFESNKTNDGQLHDDFDGSNKDVYCENNGDTSLFFRVNLKEYLIVKDSNGVVKTEVGTEDNPILHIPGSSKEDCGQKFHDYYEWTMGGHEKKFIKESGYGTITTENASNKDTYYYTPDGAIKDNRKDEDYIKEVDKMSSDDVGTTPSSKVMTMAEFKAAPTTTNVWVYDTDGWAYWISNDANGAVLPGNATGLLLDLVKANPDMDEHVNYNILATMEAVNKSQLDKWAKGAENVDDEGKAGIDNSLKVDAATPDAIQTVIKNVFDYKEAAASLSITPAAITITQNASAADIEKELGKIAFTYTDKDGKVTNGTIASPAGVSIAKPTISSATVGTQSYKITGPDGTSANISVTVSAAPIVNEPALTLSPSTITFASTATNDEINNLLKGVQVTITSPTSSATGNLFAPPTGVPAMTASDISKEVGTKKYTINGSNGKSAELTVTVTSAIKSILDPGLVEIKGVPTYNVPTTKDDASQKQQVKVMYQLDADTVPQALVYQFIDPDMTNSGDQTETGIANSYGYIPFSSIIDTNSTATITAASGAGAYIDNSSKQVVVTCLPSLSDFQEGGTLNYHPTVELTVNYGSETQKVNIAVAFDGTFQG